MKISIMKIEYFVFSSIVWCTFNESFSVFNILIGGLLGRLFLSVSRKFLGEGMPEGNNKNFSITIYFLRLMIDLYINTVSLIIILFNKELDPTLIKVKAKGRGKVTSLIANSITLTPKTSCIDKEEDILTILCAHEMTPNEILDPLEIRTLKEKDLIPSREFLKGV